MRVAYLTCLSDSGGYGRYSRELVRHVKRAGVESIILASEDSPRDFDGIPIDRCLPNLVPGPLDAMHDARCIAASCMRLLGKAQGVDLVHCLVEPYVPAAWFLAGRKPWIVSGVGSYLVLPLLKGSSPSRVARWVFKTALTQADRIVCISRYTERRLQTRMPELQQLEVLNLGVDADHFTPATNIRSSQTIVSVGALKPRKGYEFAIRAFSQVAPLFPDARYVIVGRTSNQDYRNSLQALIKSCGVADRVTTLEHVTDAELRDLYRSARMFVLPSINEGPFFEGFGLVHLEAAAAGLPCIGTLECGAEDAIVHGSTGFLVPQMDSGALAECMLTLLSDPATAERMGSAARAFALEHTWRAVAERMVGMYRELARVP